MTDAQIAFRTAVTPDGAAILDVERGSISTLNETGSFVWERLQRNESREQIIADLARVTGEDLVVVSRDVADFMTQLESKKLVCERARVSA